MKILKITMKKRSTLIVVITLILCIVTATITSCAHANDEIDEDNSQNTQTESPDKIGEVNGDALSREGLAAIMKTPLTIPGGRLPVGYWLEWGTDAVELIEYAVIDLDGDSNRETIIHYSQNKLNAWNHGYVIIYDTGESARGYTYSYEPTLILKADGAFVSNDNELSAKMIKLTFDKHPIEKLIAYSESTDDGSTKYYINDNSVSKEEFDTFWSELKKKTNAKWYEIPKDFPLTGDITPDSDDPIINGFDINTISYYPEFELAIRESIGKATGDLTRRDFLSVTSLNLSGRGIKDITPVKALVNLVDLNAASNNITDVSPLSGLQNLYVLDLSGNNLDDISPIAMLSNLATLGLDSNVGIDISPLANLNNLVNLSIQNSELTDISALIELNVTDLDLSGNNINDIRPLGTLSRIERLKLNDNPITDLSALENTTTLLGLYVVNCPIEDFSPVAHIRSIEPQSSTYKID